MTGAQQRRCLYEVLGVARDATLDQIKKAFREFIKKWHPDVNPNNKEECTARVREANEAYEILKDPEQRAAYDRHGFSARGLGAAKHQREGGPSIEDILAMFGKIADRLVRIARAESELFHDAGGEPYAYAKVGAHRETYSVRGRAFSLWLRQHYFRKYKSGVGANPMSEALATITMFAVCEGPELPVHARIGEHGGAIYIDLGDKDWRAVRVSAAGWEIITDPPVRFVRSGSMRPLPQPTKGGSIELLRKFINVPPRDEATGADDFLLLVAYALAALRPNSNYPVLALAGEQGSGKTSLVRLLGSLIDPRSPQMRSLPGDERDLIVAARHTHFLGFDNISDLSDEMSDAICRLSTGGGHGERRLYTNEEEATFEGRRPVCLNGIEDVATRPDLVDRALLLLLPAIPAGKCHEEKEIQAEFDVEAPQILGALFDGLSAGLLNLAEVEIAYLPRMADFARWAEACTRAYWPAGSFMRAYKQNITAANDVVIESSQIGDAVRRFMATQPVSEGRASWKGTASELPVLLTRIVPEPLARERSWPKSARALSGNLRRAAPPLRKVGIVVTFWREGHNRERIITIQESTFQGERVGDSASASSAGPKKLEKTRQDKGLGADASADDMRTQTKGAAANDRRGRKVDRKADGTRPQKSEQPAVANHRADNGFLRNAVDADDADANSATLSSSLPPRRPRGVPPERRPALGPEDDSLDDFE
jgi:energy-coupling factor transporter ATP-binding protein EcfA2